MTAILIIIVALLSLTALFVLLINFDKRSLVYSKDMQAKQDRYAEANKTTEIGQIVFLGDSITEQYDITNFFDTVAQVTGKKIYNRGISADTVCAVADRRFELNVTELKPEMLIFLMGTNDINKERTIEQISSDTETVIDMALTCGTKTVLLLAVYPVNKKLNLASRLLVDARKNEQIQQLNILLKNLATRKGIEFLDLNESLADAEGNLSAALTNDGLHLNNEGYKIVTKGIAPIIIENINRS